MADESDDDLLLRLLKQMAGIGEREPAKFGITPEDIQRADRNMDMMERMIREEFAEGSVKDHRRATPYGPERDRSVTLTKVLPKGLALLAPYIPAIEKEIQGMTDRQLEAELSKVSANAFRSDLLHREMDNRITEKERVEKEEKQKRDAKEERRHKAQIRWAKISVLVAILIYLASTILRVDRIAPANTRPVPIAATPTPTPAQTPAATTPIPTTATPTPATPPSNSPPPAAPRQSTPTATVKPD